MIQQVQLQHRLELVAAFGIQKGMRVLEIGYGQGDTTVAIADAAGESGSVVAIDIASPDYGAPLTLGQATERIKKSSLGERIDFHFEMDFDFFESPIPQRSHFCAVSILALRYLGEWPCKPPKKVSSEFAQLFSEWFMD